MVEELRSAGVLRGVQTIAFCRWFRCKTGPVRHDGSVAPAPSPLRPSPQSARFSRPSGPGRAKPSRGRVEGGRLKNPVDRAGRARRDGSSRENGPRATAATCRARARDDAATAVSAVARPPGHPPALRSYRRARNLIFPDRSTPPPAGSPLPGRGYCADIAYRSNIFSYSYYYVIRINRRRGGVYYTTLLS